MKKQFRLLPWLLVLPLSACSIMAKVPMTRFESPETVGQPLHFEGLMGYQGRNEVELTPDYASRAPNLADPSVEVPGHRWMGSLGVGILKRLDFQLTLPEARMGLKYQLFGSSHAEAQRGNFPVAISSSIAFLNEDRSGSGSFLGSSTARSLKLRETQIELALVAGYRVLDKLLVYGSPFLSWDKIQTDYKSESAPAATQKGTLLGFGLNLGGHLDVDEKAYVRAEAAGMHSRLGRAKVWRATYGLAVGLYF